MSKLRPINVQVLAPKDQRLIIGVAALPIDDRQPASTHVKAYADSYPAFSYWVCGEQRANKWRRGVQLLHVASKRFW